MFSTTITYDTTGPVSDDDVAATIGRGGVVIQMYRDAGPDVQIVVTL